MPTMPLPSARICLIDADDGVGVGVHAGADGVEAYEIDLDPGRGGGGAERIDGVAGEPPWARMTPFCLASERTSMAPR